MTNLTDYDILVSVQSELDKLRKDYNTLLLANLRLIKLLKDCKPYVNSRFIETRERLNKPYTASDNILHNKAEKLLTKIDEVLK